LIIINCQLLIINYPLPITQYPLPITCMKIEGKPQQENDKEEVVISQSQGSESLGQITSSDSSFISSSSLSSNWRVVSASVMGTSHEKRSQPCQDAHFYQVLPNGVLVAAVADGAGSALLADVGAQIAVKTVVNSLAQRDAIPPCDDEVSWKAFLFDILKESRSAVETEALKREMSPREFACTLIFVVATSELVAAIQVGDGAAVLGDSQGNIIGLTTPPLGEYINETIFLVSDGALESAQFSLWKGKPGHLALFSDGLQLLALKMPSGSPHSPFFSPLFRFMDAIVDEKEAEEQLVSFLRSPRVTERTDDDLTLLLARYSS
ncbi:MAG: PP2C family serine/threonine-protein phosphatase, partial [Microcoleaceae cyanobacterium]